MFPAQECFDGPRLAAAAFSFVVVNTGVDVLYAAANPRIRYG